jgi:geranylgeranyl transferase type-1 subunit beta
VHLLASRWLSLSFFDTYSAGLKSLQMPNGAFRATLSESGEADVRFLYCACAISAALGDWAGVDTERAVAYILRCITYEGGIAVMPGIYTHIPLLRYNSCAVPYHGGVSRCSTAAT